MKDKNAAVIVDTRESRSKVPKSLEKSLNVTYKTLLYGDYQINEDVIFERKSYNDFNHSITDGRLFKQAKNLKENYKNPIIILEGMPEYGKGNYNRLLPRDTVLGACLSCVVDIGIPVVPTLSQADTARLIIRAAKRDGKASTTYKVNNKKKGKTCYDHRRNIMECFPGIGAKTSEKVAASEFPLMELFKSFQSGDTDLIKGKQLKNVQRVLQQC